MLSGNLKFLQGIYVQFNKNITFNELLDKILTNVGIII